MPYGLQLCRVPSRARDGDAILAKYNMATIRLDVNNKYKTLRARLINYTPFKGSPIQGQGIQLRCCFNDLRSG